MNRKRSTASRLINLGRAPLGPRPFICSCAINPVMLESPDRPPFRARRVVVAPALPRRPDADHRQKPAGLLHRFMPAPAAGPTSNIWTSFALASLKLPALAHRLDRDTSGCLILGRHAKALRKLGKLFQEGRIGKTYWAIVEGIPPAAEAGSTCRSARSIRRPAGAFKPTLGRPGQPTGCHRLKVLGTAAVSPGSNTSSPHRSHPSRSACISSRSDARSSATGLWHSAPSTATRRRIASPFRAIAAPLYPEARAYRRGGAAAGGMKARGRLPGFSKPLNGEGSNAIEPIFSRARA